MESRIETLYRTLSLPDSGRLSKRVFKKLFFENAKLTATDKRAFQDDLDTVTWQYALKPDTIPIKPYTDDEREYLEIAVLQADLKQMRHVSRLTEIIHRAIPYPLLLVMTFENTCSLSIALKRFSLGEHGVIVVEDAMITDWFDSSQPNRIVLDFLQSLTIDKLPQQHFYALYQAWVERFVAYACAKITGKFSLPQLTRNVDRRQILSDCQALKTEIDTQLAAIKEETQMQRKVDANMNIKKLERRYRELISQLG